MAGKSVAKKKRVGRYLALPYHILNLTGIGLCQKVLLAHIYGFGENGCYQSNRTLADIFMVSVRTLCRWIIDLNNHLYIKAPKGYYRTMWAKMHPDVGATIMSEKFNNANRSIDKSVQQARQNCRSDYAKSGFRVRQECLTINTKINKEIKREITPPPPLPAMGQASAVMSDRKEQGKAMAEKFKKSFGRGLGKRKGKVKVGLTSDEFEQRRQQMLRSLTAV